MSWIDQYRSKLVTAHEAVNCVKSGMRVYIHPGCAEPEALVEALMSRAPFVKNVELIHLLTHGHFALLRARYGGALSPQRAVCRWQCARGRECRPRRLHSDLLSEIEALFESGEMPIDVAFIQVSPPDSHGYCSFGVGVDITLDRREVCPEGRRASECADAAHLWRQLHPREPD